MDEKLTKDIQQWLDTPAEERDLEQGALYLLKLSRNAIMHRNISANLKRHAADIEYQLRKYLGYRLQSVTHAEVLEMQAQVNAIVEKNHLNMPTKTKAEKKKANDEFKKGKRTDHDALPQEIQALYEENLPLIQKMRALHAKLVVLSTANTTCPDSERYPFLKELIELDKRYHANWKAYDSYGKEAAE